MFGYRPASISMLAILALCLAAPSAPVMARDHGSAPEFPGQERVSPFLLEALSGSGTAKSSGSTTTVVHGAGTLEELIQSVRNAGAEVQASSGNLVQASLSAAQIRRLARDSAVSHMRLPHRAHPTDFKSEALPGTAISRFAEQGVSGEGVRVVVLDIGFAGYTVQKGDELPDTVAVRNFNHEGFETTSHGTAVAEVIHDVAPDAEITLVSFLTDVEFMEALDWIKSRRPGIHVVNASIGFTNVGPLNGQSAITRAANLLLERHDILYVNSAGNERNRYYSAKFSDPDGNGWHDFASGDESLDLHLNGGQTYDIVLNWEDWGSDPERPAASSDYDLFIWCPGSSSNDPEQACQSSKVRQSGDLFDQPLERLRKDASEGGTYRLGIRRVNDSAVKRFHLSFNGSAISSFEYSTAESTIELPGDGASVLTVGAFHYADPGRDYNPNVKASDPGFTIEDWQAEIPPQTYSSRGPTWDGRKKPDISGPDCVSTATFSFEGFCGTSAATPHVAGAAALLKAQVPSRSAASLRRILIATADDVKPLGADNDHGAGRLSLTAAADKKGISTRSGLWGNPDQFGHGFFMEAQGDVLSLLWYVYDTEGNPVWLMSNGRMEDDGTFHGRVLRFTGPSRIGSPLSGDFDAQGSTRDPADVGSITVRFTGDATASISVSIQGGTLLAPAQYAVDVQQFLISPPASSTGMAYASPISGLWYVPSQNGHGFVINRQGNLRSPDSRHFPTDKLIVAWFGYRRGGDPQWLLGSGSLDGAESFQKADTMMGTRLFHEYDGPRLDGSQSLEQLFDRRGHGVSSRSEGRFSVEFQSRQNATLQFEDGNTIDEPLAVERMKFLP